MTAQDEQDLRELQAELVQADQSLWEPACVAAAFCTTDAPFVLTMQGWIDLEAAESPFLLGSLPDAEVALDHFRLAFAAFGHERTTPEECDPEELVALGRMMLRAISAGFSMRARLAPPDGCKMVSGDNGLGEWLPIVACLKSQLGFSLTEAMALPVAQAFALVAAHRCNEGWSVCGETYRMRNVPNAEGGSGNAEVWASGPESRAERGDASLNTESLNTEHSTGGHHG